MNVSVRVDSPGDDGAVEQVNVAAAQPAPQYQPEPAQYQDSIPAPDAPAAESRRGCRSRAHRRGRRLELDVGLELR